MGQARLAPALAREVRLRYDVAYSSFHDSGALLACDYALVQGDTKVSAKALGKLRSGSDGGPCAPRSLL